MGRRSPGVCNGRADKYLLMYCIVYDIVSIRCKKGTASCLPLTVQHTTQLRQPKTDLENYLKIHFEMSHPAVHMTLKYRYTSV
jgi:hypothetical protein